VALGALAALAATTLVLSGAVALASSGISGAGVTPKSYPGNFVASDDDQVCFELEKLKYISSVTTDMRGVKIDPPTGFSNQFVTVTLSTDGKYLDWATKNGAQMVAIIVKGGPNYNVYDYVNENLAADTGLHSPLNKGKVPQISHYNICYTVPTTVGDQGCTPGYWKNHLDRWEGVLPGHDFNGTFGVDLFNPNIDLQTAIGLTGGGNSALARHATAALLNAHGGVANADGTTVSYPYTVADVIAMVKDAVAEGTIEATKDLFADANQLGCPLSGTRAT
jgi:hypothetical protein